MDMSVWSLFLLTSLITTLSPGPNTLLVMTHAVRHGMGAAALTVAANLSSQFIFMMLVIFGFGAVLAQTPMLYYAIKTAGALYLIYLGVRTLLAARDIKAMAVSQDNDAVTPPLRKRYIEAFLVSSGNPKTVLFLSALLPQFLDTSGNLWLQFSTMYVTNALVILTIHLGFGYAALALSGQVVSARLRQRISQLAGTTFIALGIGLITARMPN